MTTNSKADEGFDSWPDLEPGEGATVWWTREYYEAGSGSIYGGGDLRDIWSSRRTPPYAWKRMPPADPPVRKVRVGDYAPCIVQLHGRPFLITDTGQSWAAVQGPGGWATADTLVPETDIKRIADIFPTESEASK